MSSRININRVPQSYTPAYDAPRARPYVDSSSQSFQDDPISKIKQFAAKAEDMVDMYSQPLRPHLPAIGRFLIVVTFLEDALRILTQWSDQLWYLQRCVVLLPSSSYVETECILPTRHRSFPWGISHLFLLINVLVRWYPDL
ncbi:SURF4-domain-containing protein [Clavulina sp. PMI_390]|nr:SURF4-domain-containing protein [Clavulina sp. PMI_390]